MMNITGIRAIPLTAAWSDIFGGEDKVPHALRHPAAHFTTFPRQGQYSTLVTVAIGDGVEGVGEAWGLPLPTVTASLVKDYLRPALIGRDAEDIEGIWADIYGMAEKLGHTRGFLMEALSGVDIALWDLRGRLRGQTLAGLLGSSRRERIPGYASPVPLHEAPADSAAAAKAFAEKGFTAIKVKAGRSLDVDLAHLAAIRAAIGPDTRLLVDFNCSYDVEKTIAFAREAEPLGIYWIEEPLPPEQIDEMAAVRRQIAIPVATGENEFSPAGFRDLLARGAADILTPNVTRAGGITGVLKIGEIARAHGARIALHGVGSGVMLAASLNLMSTLPNSDLFEYNQLLNPLRDQITRQPFRFAGGALAVPDLPGIGCEIAEETVAKYAAARRQA
jgi:D-arabinonate dehydratase/D-galactarolactone cycloisomerase